MLFYIGILAKFKKPYLSISSSYLIRDSSLVTINL